MNSKPPTDSQKELGSRPTEGQHQYRPRNPGGGEKWATSPQCCHQKGATSVLHPVPFSPNSNSWERECSRFGVSHMPVPEGIQDEVRDKTMEYFLSDWLSFGFGPVPEMDKFRIVDRRDSLPGRIGVSRERGRDNERASLITPSAISSTVLLSLYLFCSLYVQHSYWTWYCFKQYPNAYLKIRHTELSQ